MVVTHDNEAALTLDAAFEDLIEAGYDVPERAIRWLGDNWQEHGPALLDILRAFISGENREERTTHLLSFITYLAAEKRDTTAFGVICDLAMLDGELLDESLGDAWITESLSPILTGTFDGDVARLKNLIETREADSFASNAALQALFWLTLHGKIARDETEAYLGDLFASFETRGDDHLWMTWAIVIGFLGFERHRNLVKSAFDRGYIGPEMMSYEHFEADLASGLAQDDRLREEAEQYAPVEDTVAVMSGWYWFSEQRRKDDQRYEAYKAEPAPIPLPTGPKIGRNDPCPCGSGKKYKKCCLRTPA